MQLLMEISLKCHFHFNALYVIIHDTNTEVDWLLLSWLVVAFKSNEVTMQASHFLTDDRYTTLLRT